MTVQFAYFYEIFSSFFRLNLAFFFFLTMLVFVGHFALSLSPEPTKSSIALLDALVKRVAPMLYLASLSSMLVSFYYFYLALSLSCLHCSESAFFFTLTSVDLDFFFIPMSIDIYGFVLLLLAYLVGFFSLLTLDTRLSSSKSRFFVYFSMFVLIVFLYVSTSDILLFFLFYELLLLPSFFFVYFVSYSKKALQASVYFVIWTQVGSLLVLLSVLYIVYTAGTTSFLAIRAFPFTQSEATIAFALLFFGFGFKVPIWPFHYWLTKTHVEAPSGFSIYLSGFLVKSALFGFFKLGGLLFIELSTLPFIIIAFLGAIDASFKLWGQSDLKKLVAYCTIQEMNLILLMFLWGDSYIVVCGFLFSAAHAMLSALMFYLVDCVYRRMHSRSVYTVSGLYTLYPRLGAAIFFMVIFFGGLPGTLKFSCEFFIFSTLLSVSWPMTLVLVFSLNFFGLVGFSKCWFNSIFGLPKSSLVALNLDLSRKESSLILLTYAALIFLSYFFFVVL